jgi:hypothetical protein
LAKLGQHAPELGFRSQSDLSGKSLDLDEKAPGHLHVPASVLHFGAATQKLGKFE